MESSPVAYYLRELGHDFRRYGRVGVGQVIQIVESIEEERRVNLCLEELEFGEQLRIFQGPVFSFQREPVH
ncbi:hypothetical protein GCM10027348_39870 [Hymenobacter tenuis]